MIYYLLYDEDCSLCVKFQRGIHRFDRRNRIETMGFHDPRIKTIVPTMTQEELFGNFHLVLPDGSVKSGNRALPDLLKILPGWKWAGWLLQHLPPVQWLSDRVYLWIARQKTRTGHSERAVRPELSRRVNGASKDSS